MSAFSFAHPDQGVERLAQGLFHRRPEGGRVAQTFLRLQDARRSNQHLERYRVRQLQIPRQPVQLPRIGLGQRRVQLHLAGPTAVGGVQSHLDREPAARDAPIDLVPKTRFERFQFARKVNGNLALPPVHRAELDGDLEAVLSALAAAVTRHRFHECGDYGERTWGRRTFFGRWQAGRRAGCVQRSSSLLNQGLKSFIWVFPIRPWPPPALRPCRRDPRDSRLRPWPWLASAPAGLPPRWRAAIRAAG